MKTMASRKGYTYTKLNDLKLGRNFNVYGILVGIVKVNVTLPTSGRIHSIVSLTDESLPPGDFINMHLFLLTEFPDSQFVVGNIFRFHRVKVETYENKFDGRIFNSSDVVVFPKAGTSRKYFTTAKSITINDDDWKRVQDLREIVSIESLFKVATTNNESVVPNDGQEKPQLNNLNKLVESEDENEDNPGSTNHTKHQPETSLHLVRNPLAVERQLLPNPFYVMKKHMKLDSDTDETQANDTAVDFVCSGSSCKCGHCSLVLATLEASDTVLDDEDERSLVAEGLGNIPGIDEHGNIISRSGQSIPVLDSENAKYISAKTINNFQWPRYSVQVQITSMKPKLQVLQATNSKDLLAGFCPTCGSYTKYSDILWELQSSGHKKPFCLPCHKNCQKSYVSLEFRMRFIGVDPAGSAMTFYAAKQHACTFLDCLTTDYENNAACRASIVTLLTKALQSKSFCKLEFFCCLTSTKRLNLICNTKLSEALTQ